MHTSTNMNGREDLPTECDSATANVEQEHSTIQHPMTPTQSEHDSVSVDKECGSSVLQAADDKTT